MPRQLCGDTSDTVVIENNAAAPKKVAIHFQASPLFSMRTGSLALSQSCRSVFADAWCKWALTRPEGRKGQGLFTRAVQNPVKTTVKVTVTIDTFFKVFFNSTCPTQVGYKRQDNEYNPGIVVRGNLESLFGINEHLSTWLINEETANQRHWDSNLGSNHACHLLNFCDCVN